MASPTWFNWLRNVTGVGPRVAKRAQQSGRRWEIASECLEQRTLLSAVSVAEPVAAEVSAKKGMVQFPNVAGTWAVTVGGTGEGTLVITQDGAKVSSTLTIAQLPPIHTSGKFTKRHTHELSGSTKVGGLESPHKIKVTVTIVFPLGSLNPTTFIGQATVDGQNISLNGTKQVGTGTLAPPNGAKAAKPFHNISGSYVFSISGDQLGTIEGTLHVIQTGKRKELVYGQMTGVIDAAVSVVGKFNKKAPQTITGGVVITVVGTGTKPAAGTITFGEDFTSFEGTATLENGDELTLSGDLDT